MKYRHSYHAGNFAGTCTKALWTGPSLCFSSPRAQRTKGVLYFETPAGSGDTRRQTRPERGSGRISPGLSRGPVPIPKSCRPIRTARGEGDVSVLKKRGVVGGLPGFHRFLARGALAHGRIAALWLGEVLAPESVGRYERAPGCGLRGIRWKWATAFKRLGAAAANTTG